MSSPPENFLFGPRLGARKTEFRLWAPAERQVELALADGPQIAMPRGENGLCNAVSDARPGARYAFTVGGETRVPDPASRLQDGDVAEFSVVTDPNSYRWQSTDWRGRPSEETVFYELHVGLLGGFAGVAQHLERIARLGFTAIELMPIGDFPGARNRGYDGVLPFAPERAYGPPDDLKSLIDRAHGVGLMVCLDVVYNHFGPDGNRIAEYAPQFFRSDVATPWGAAIDFRERTIATETIGEAAVVARWRMGDGATLTIATNLGHEIVRTKLPDRTPVWGEATDVLPAETTLARIEG